jgi:DnaJ-class molecular chaperone
MTKRQAKASLKQASVTEPETVGGRVLVTCPVCAGFGGIVHDDGDWCACKKCGGGGKVWATEATP